MVKVIDNSNLLDVQTGIICHQVNCVGVMGAGLALQIRNRWPTVYDAYREDCKIFEKDPKKLLGHIQDILVNDNLVVANCYGQVFPGKGCMTDYRAWDLILDKLSDLSSYFNLDLHFPWMIGCGLAGGDWKTMYSKISSKFAKSATLAVVHKLS